MCIIIWIYKNIFFNNDVSKNCVGTPKINGSCNGIIKYYYEYVLYALYSSPIKICFIRIIHNRRTALPTRYHVLVYAENENQYLKII